MLHHVRLLYFLHNNTKPHTHHRQGLCTFSCTAVHLATPPRGKEFINTIIIISRTVLRGRTQKKRTAIECIECGTRFSQMDWGSLPLNPLEGIFRRLKFRDRLTCALVCRHWNKTLFCCPTLARGIVLAIGGGDGGGRSTTMREVLRASERNYRHLSIVLNEEAEAGGGVNECLAEVRGLRNVQSVSVVGEPATLRECFRSNVELFGGITELNLELTKNIDWLPFERQDVVMGELKKLHYLQMYLGREQVSAAFRLVVPKLESVSIMLDSMANEEAMYWEDPLIEVDECDKLRSLEVDLNSTMWEDFFAKERPHLERLLIRRASDEFQERDWDRIFMNMPNLRNVEMVFSSDAMLASLRRNCKKVDNLVLNGFCYHDGSFASNMAWSTMKQLFLDGWLNGGVYSSDPSLNLPSLQELHWKYVELTPAQGCFTIVTPRLRTLTLRGCDYKRFNLKVGPHLETLDIDYYGPQQLPPNFFSSLHALTRMTLHINGESLKLVQLLTYPMLQLRHLEMICGTEHRGYDINELFGAFCRHSPSLEELTVRNEHENPLQLDYGQFSQIANLQHLQSLTIQYVTLLNVSGRERVRMAAQLTRLDVSGCRAMDPAGMVIEGDSFPIEAEGLVATEEMEWSASSAF